MTPLFWVLADRTNAKFVKIWITILFAASTLICRNLAFCGEIHDAAKNGDLETVEVLLNASPNLVNSKDNNGETPLMVASYTASVRDERT